MRTVPFSSFAYRLDGALRPRGSLKRRYDAEQVYQARPRPDTSSEVRTPARCWPRVLHFHADRLPLALAGPGDRKMRSRDSHEIWDSGQVRTVRGARTLIVHHPGQEELAARLLRVADRAYTQVGAAWTGRWERKAVILVPATRTRPSWSAPATCRGWPPWPPPRSVGQDRKVLGNRIVVNTSNVDGYDGLNLQVLITHEMTHVATQASATACRCCWSRGSPAWAALKPVGLPFSATRPALSTRAKSGPASTAPCPPTASSAAATR